MPPDLSKHVANSDPAYAPGSPSLQARAEGPAKGLYGLRFKGVYRATYNVYRAYRAFVVLVVLALEAFVCWGFRV